VIPAYLIVDLMDRWLASDPRIEAGNVSRGRVDAHLADSAGLAPRRLWEIRNASKLLSIDVVDRLLIAMGYEHEWHIALEDY
jgi:hypothetical protein